MSRPLVEAEIEGRKMNAILDTGAWRSYIRLELARDFPVVPVQPFEVKLEGGTLSVKEGRLVSGIIKDTEGRAYQFGNVLYPVSDIGEENGKRIDLLFVKYPFFRQIVSPRFPDKLIGYLSSLLILKKQFSFPAMATTPVWLSFFRKRIKSK